MTEVFWEIHRDLPQEGPGSDACTLQALSHVRELPKQPRILDIGCGPGRQTLALAKATRGTIVAVDTHQPFLDQLAASALRAGLASRITTLNRSMSELDFADGSFDLVWSEGAAYFMGFPAALHAWRRLLKPSGWVAVSECVWLTERPSFEIASFFDVGYPAMLDVKGNVWLAESNGYEVVSHFVLPAEAWRQYYGPILAKLPELKRRFAGDPKALKFVEAEEEEMRLFERFGDEYGYAFYVLRRRER